MEIIPQKNAGGENIYIIKFCNSQDAEEFFSQIKNFKSIYRESVFYDEISSFLKKRLSQGNKGTHHKCFTWASLTEIAMLCEELYLSNFMFHEFSNVVQAGEFPNIQISSSDISKMMRKEPKL